MDSAPAWVGATERRFATQQIKQRPVRPSLPPRFLIDEKNIAI